MIVSMCLLSLTVLQAQPQPEAKPTTSGQPSTATAQDEDPGLIRRLETIDAYAARLTDLTASFEQRRHTPLLRKPVVSSGKVRVKGSTVRWDTGAPSASVLVIDAASLRIFYPEQHTLEVYPIASGLDRLAATPLPRLKAIREQFYIRACKLSEMDGIPADSPTAAVAVLLLPKGDELKKYVREVRVLLDEPPSKAEPSGDSGEKSDEYDHREKHPYGIARQVEVTDADGDRTVIVFKEIKTNTGLTDRDIELIVPDGTRVSRPLEGAAPSGTERKDQK